MLKSIRADCSGNSTTTKRKRINENLVSGSPIFKRQKFSIEELLNESAVRNECAGEPIPFLKNILPIKNLTINYLQCKLEAENKNLWKMFCKIGTEMIITKPGR